MNIFEAVHDRVTAEEAARYYGLDFNARGQAVCPFHHDTHPSMTFKNGRFRCWACGAAGDSIDFVSKLFDSSPLDAAKRINADFSLGLSDKPAAPDDLEKRRRAAEVAEKHRLFEHWRETLICKLNKACRVGHYAMMHCSNLDALSAQEATAIRMHECFLYWSDLLSTGSPQDQIQMYQERRAIALWIEKVLKDI